MVFDVLWSEDKEGKRIVLWNCIMPVFLITNPDYKGAEMLYAILSNWYAFNSLFIANLILYISKREREREIKNHRMILYWKKFMFFRVWPVICLLVVKCFGLVSIGSLELVMLLDTTRIRWYIVFNSFFFLSQYHVLRKYGFLVHIYINLLKTI